MVSGQSNKIDEIDALSNMFGNTSNILRQNKADSLYGDISIYDENVKRIDLLTVPDESWNYLTALLHYVEPSVMPNFVNIKEDYITVVPTARFIVDSLWGKIKVSRKYFNPDGTIKENLRVMEKWYACFLSDDVRKRWLSDLKEGKEVEIFRTFNHKTKEVKTYFGKLDGEHLCKTEEDDSGKTVYYNSLAVTTNSGSRYVCSRLKVQRSGRIIVMPNNTSNDIVNFINDACYKYGIGYLKTPLQTRGSRKLSSLQINL